GGIVNAVLAIEDTQGDAVYVSGSFSGIDSVPVNNIARWNGSTWASVGTGLTGTPGLDYYAFVLDYAAVGPAYERALYAGGTFSVAGGVPASRIAKWDGTAWSALGAGLTGATPTSAHVTGIASFDDGLAGGGPSLYASGTFTFADGLPAS